jgi:ribosome-binding protein aMBF1 (putative translation factor)
MTNLKELKKEMLADPKVRSEYDALGTEFAIAEALIRARTHAGMTQADVAEKMKTSQSRVARLEGGANASIDTLKRYAEATGTTLSISLDPQH